jgi:hypothetical protein
MAALIERRYLGGLHSPFHAVVFLAPVRNEEKLTVMF